MSREKAEKKFKKAYANEGGTGNPITIITLLITFISKFLESCQAKDIKQLAKENPVFVELKLRREARRNGHSIKEAKIIAASGLETINQSSASDLENLEG